MAAASTWHWCRWADQMASQRRWHPILSGRQGVPRAGVLMNCVSSLSLPAPSQLVLICTSEMRGRYLSSGKRTGAELWPPRWQVGCQDTHAAWLAGCSRPRFSCICVAANATLLPEDGKEKTALRDERTESTRLLQGQEEEEKRLRDASQVGTMRITQDINNQVGRKGGCCWGQRPGRERVAGWDFPSSDHGPGTRWAGLSCFQEKECVRKGLGSLEPSGNESLRVGRARASLNAGSDV